MSLAIVFSRALLGVQAPEVRVEVHLSGGLPALSIVGLPEATVRESRERVRSALLNSGFEFPQRRITINLAPADLPKEGGRFDLAIALGILVASGQVPPERIERAEFIGELALSGELRGVSGVLPAALACREASRQMVLAADNSSEVGLVESLEASVAHNLLDVTAWLRQQRNLSAATALPLERPADIPCLSDVRGQFQAKRALEVAAAAGHNLLMCGPPGSGKSMLAARLPGLLPALNNNERLEVASICSVAALDVTPACQGIRPFRSPHHTASAVALVGGGSFPKPGEVSLAHQGVLFLDELPEFSRSVLEVLREPLETGHILISRAAMQMQYPAGFQLVAAMNPCPCGYFGESGGRCRCSPEQVRRYQAKISGPLLDRFDLMVGVSAIPPDELLSNPDQDAGSEVGPMLERITTARKAQYNRQGKLNRQLTAKEMDRYCQLQPEQKQFLVNAIKQLKLSARASHRIIRVARTLADLSGDKDINQQHLIEALSFRTGTISYFSAAE